MDEMLRSISAKQFQEWAVFSELEVLPDERLELMLSHILQVLLNTNRRKGSTPLTLDQVRMKFGDAREAAKKVKTHWTELKRIGAMMTKASLPRRKKGA